MGCFNWLFKILGIILMIMAVVLLPLTLLANEVGDLLFSTDNIFSIIDDELINPEFMEDLIGEVLVELQPEGENAEEDAMRDVIMEMMSGIQTETLNEAVALLFPVDMLSDLFGNISDGFYIWLNSEGYDTGVVVDLKPLKVNVSENVDVVMAAMFEDMPECSEADLEGGNWDMTCKPPEEFDEQINTMLDETIQNMMAEIPDEINIDEFLYEQGDDMAVMRNSLKLIRDVLDYVWVLVLGIFLMGVILGARTIQGFFGWTGWPLLITSLIIIMFGILFNTASVSIINFGITKIDFEIPSFLVAPVYSIIASIFGMIGTGMLWKGLIIFTIGLVAIIISVIISTYRNKMDQTPKNSSDELLLSDIKPIEKNINQVESE